MDFIGPSSANSREAVLIKKSGTKKRAQFDKDLANLPLKLKLLDSTKMRNKFSSRKSYLNWMHLHLISRCLSLFIRNANFINFSTVSLGITCSCEKNPNQPASKK